MLRHKYQSLLAFGIGALAVTGLSLSTAHASDPKVPFERYTLENGLEVILHQDRKLPLVMASVWYHVAVERYDDVCTIWVDGAVLGSFALTVTFHQGTAPLVIGGNNEGTQDFTGHIDGVRVVKGSALRARVIAPELLFDSTSDDSELLLNFEGADGATGYTSDDVKGRSLTFLGTAELDDAQRGRGLTSLWLQDSSDQVTIADDGDLTLGTDDFTIELMIRPDVVTGTQIFYDQRTADPQVRPTIYIQTTLRFWTNGAVRITGPTLVADTWYHVVVQRVAGITRMYVDGLQVGSDYTDSNDYLGGTLYLGTQSYSPFTNGMQGWIDMVRVSKGRAIYGGDFNVPILHPGEPIV